MWCLRVRIVDYWIGQTPVLRRLDHLDSLGRPKTVLEVQQTMADHGHECHEVCSELLLFLIGPLYIKSG